MKKVSIIIPNGFSSIVNIEGTRQILSWVNDFYASINRKIPFEIQLVSVNKNLELECGDYIIRPKKSISNISNTDIIIIPAIFGEWGDSYKNNEELVPWLKKQYENGAEIVTYCIGAFFLAATGLLEGKKCTTHWHYASEFRNRFPNIELIDDKILTEDNRLYTSGGAYSYLNLLIYLIEKNTDRNTAITVAKSFMIDIDKLSQSPFIIFNGQKNHNDSTIKDLQSYIENNYQSKIIVDELSNKFAIAKRTLERRFKKATSNTLSEYIQRVKVEAAKKLLETENININELMYKVGYQDEKSFRMIFKKVSGMTPKEYKKMYNGFM